MLLIPRIWWIHTKPICRCFQSSQWLWGKLWMAAEVRAGCPWKTEKADALNETGGFYHLESRPYTVLGYRAPVLRSARDSVTSLWDGIRIEVSLYMLRVPWSPGHEHREPGTAKDLSSFSTSCCFSLHQLPTWVNFAHQGRSILQFQHVVHSNHIGKKYTGVTAIESKDGATPKQTLGIYLMTGRKNGNFWPWPWVVITEVWWASSAESHDRTVLYFCLFKNK